MQTSILCLCGGVGGAKLALGFASLMSPGKLGIIVNTGDDFEHFGLHISPDLDTVMYTLAGRVNVETGWGRADESWTCMEGVRAFGAEDWFALGDRDLATHLARTGWLRGGMPLGEVTSRLSHALGVTHDIVPATDDAVRTVVETLEGPLAFQHYFVRERCGPAVRSIRFEGAEDARPGEGALQWLARDELAAIIICPSNPYLSMDPILAVPGIRQALRTSAAPVVAVSPIVGGRAIKGPTAKIMDELSLPLTPTTVASHYADFLDGFILDTCDKDAVGAIEDLGIATRCTPIVMPDDKSKSRLAREVIEFAESLTEKFQAQSGGLKT